MRRGSAAADQLRCGPSRELSGAALTPVLETRALSKTYPIRRPAKLRDRILRRGTISRLHALDRVDLTVMPGEAVGLVGESGCGKSTLARLVSRLIEPDGGEIRLDGTAIQEIPAGRFARSSMRRQIQMVFQDPTESLNPRFSVREAIADPVKTLLPGEGRRETEARVVRASEQVGLPADLLGRYPHQLSGGQKARVGIARAMVVEPRLLVLDEPTSALDVSVQALVLKLLANLRREAGIALLFVSHDLNIVRLLCDRIVVMYLGQVVETGSARDVFRDPRHPYTQALLSAIPRWPGLARPPVQRLPGELQSPIDPDPSACRLFGRCPRQRDVCRVDPPKLVADAADRQVRCHFPGTTDPASTPDLGRESRSTT